MTTFTQILVLEPAWSLLPIGYGVIFALIAWNRRAEIRALFTDQGRSCGKRSLEYSDGGEGE